MSDPLTDRLSRFTPDATALDRDGLLFAAGRASARPNRIWRVLAAILAASQVLSLVLLWPRSIPLAVAPVPAPPADVVPIGPSPSEPGSPLVGRNLLDLEKEPPSYSNDNLVPDQPPLGALASLRNFSVD